MDVVRNVLITANKRSHTINKKSDKTMMCSKLNWCVATSNLCVQYVQKCDESEDRVSQIV